MATVCVSVSNNPTLLAHLTASETLAANFALEFGQKCGIFSAVDSMLDSAKDFVEPLETALKDVTESLSGVINELKTVLSQFAYLAEEAIDLIDSFMTAALALINSTISAIDTLTNTIAGQVASATNALASALCNTLNSAITGLPSNVVLSTPGLAAAALLDKNNPAKFLKDAMETGVNTAKASIIDNVLNMKSNIDSKLPNLTSYVCTP